VRIWRSRSFTYTDAGESRIVWRSPNSGAACRAVWAPEIHFVQSRWYIYFAATTCDDKNENHRMFVIENTNADPFTSTFTWKGQITDATNKWAIDGTVLQHTSGQLYFIWSGWQGDVNERQILYIARMSNPWTISSARVEIARPVYSWEINHRPYINEGPQVTIRNGIISLVYSASGSWTNDYCLGLITASTSSDPMNAASWQKRANPIFRSANSIFGPGHQSFTKSRDGREDWIIYHSARYSGSGWTRQVRAQQFTWNIDSTPNLGSPVNPNIPIRIPSGDQNRDRYEAEHARLLNGPYAHPHSSASNGLKVGFIDYADSTVEFTVQCPKAGTYVIVIRNGNGSAGDALATHWLTINNGNRIEIPIVYSGWDKWGASMIRTTLKQGANTLTFKKGTNFAEIDEVDVFLDE
jgi:GH43 family beta-xylosidase